MFASEVPSHKHPLKGIHNALYWLVGLLALLTLGVLLYGGLFVGKYYVNSNGPSDAVPSWRTVTFSVQQTTRNYTGLPYAYNFLGSLTHIDNSSAVVGETQGHCDLVGIDANFTNYQCTQLFAFSGVDPAIPAGSLVSIGQLLYAGDSSATTNRFALVGGTSPNYAHADGEVIILNNGTVTVFPNLTFIVDLPMS